MRICSLLPSATEIVYALGLGDHLVGVTHECDYPSEAARLPSVTRNVLDHSASSSEEINRHVALAAHEGSSIYHLDQAVLERLNPDIILTQELCKVCAVSYSEVRAAARLLPGDRTVLSLEPTSLHGILTNIEEVGRVAGVLAQARGLMQRLQERIDEVASRAAKTTSRPRVLTIEWLAPVFIGGHWVPEMVRLAGGTDVLGQEGRHSTIVTWEQIAACDPEIVVLMPCGFNPTRTETELRRTHFPDVWQSLAAVRSGRVYAVDGSAYFNRPGPRIVDGLEILAEIIQPDLFARTKPPEAWRRVSHMPE